MHDYLDADQIDRIISGRGIAKDEDKKVRDWTEKKYLINF